MNVYRFSNEALWCMGFDLLSFCHVTKIDGPPNIRHSFERWSLIVKDTSELLQDQRLRCLSLVGGIMDKVKGVAKGGWHPTGKDGGKESWRGDHESINRVVSATPNRS